MQTARHAMSRASWWCGE